VRTRSERTKDYIVATPAQSTASNAVEAVPSHYRSGARLSWHQRRRHRAVLSLLKGVRGTALDYGCGYGDLTHAISRSHRVVGCDVDPERVAFARSEYGSLEFDTCTSDRTPYAQHSFDIVVSAVVIHFVADPVAYIDEIKRIVRPGGRLLIVCRNHAIVRNTFRRFLGREREPTKLWILSQPDMKAFLSGRGFEVERSTYFYDPPFGGWKNIGDWAVGSIEQLLSMTFIRAPAGYHAYLTRCTEQ